MVKARGREGNPSDTKMMRARLFSHRLLDLLNLDRHAGVADSSTLESGLELGLQALLPHFSRRDGPLALAGFLGCEHTRRATSHPSRLCDRGRGSENIRIGSRTCCDHPFWHAHRDLINPSGATVSFTVLPPPRSPSRDLSHARLCDGMMRDLRSP